MTSTKPVVAFDHHSSAHAADPESGYRELRESCPMSWTDAHDGYWVLANYDLVFDAARDPSTFSSAREEGDDRLSILIPKREHGLHIPIELDPPDFRKYRSIINLFLSPAAVEPMSGRVDHYTTAFIDEVIEDGHCDFTDVIGIPAALTLEWLGLPTDRWREYAHAFHVLLSEVPGDPDFDHAVKHEVPQLAEETRAVISQRRNDRRDDVISQLFDQQVDGRPLTEEEIFSIVDLLIAGGVSTVASFLSKTVVWLAEHTDVRQQLIDDPSLLEHAVEEFLRYFTPAQAVARTVSHDGEFHGCPVSKGDRVLMSWASANRDNEAFDRPDEVDIARWPNRHVAFGLGPHRCAGAHLARVAARRSLAQILDRMPDFRLATDKLEPFPDQSVSVGYRSIPLEFTPGPRRLS
jgi:cytochrome P450